MTTEDQAAFDAVLIANYAVGYNTVLTKEIWKAALAHRDEQIKGLVEALEFVWRGMKSGNIKAQPYLDFSDPNAANLELKSPVALIESALAAYKEQTK